jgi:MFS family permease
MKKKLNYMWVIVVTCFIMEFVALGFCSSNKSLYLGAITEALSIPRSLFSLNDSIRFLTTAVINLFFGTLIQKFGARKMVAAGFLCLIGSTQVYAHAESVFVFYIGGEIVDGLFSRDNISHLSHILGGLSGAVLGYALERRAARKEG